MNTYNFEKAWDKVNSLEKQGLSKSVFKKVTEIHKEALDASAAENLIKALIYQGKYYNEVEEDAMVKTIELFEESIAKAGQAEKSIMQSLLAELYDIYLMRNLWKINKGTENAESTDLDIRNWSPGQFVDKSTNLYLTSLEYEDLKDMGLDDYQSLIKESENTEGLRSTLYDVLAHRAVDYFKEGKPFLVQAPDRYILKDEKLFANAKTFIGLSLPKDPSDRESTVLNIFQNLTKKHFEDKNKKELVDLDLTRLNYVRKNFISKDKDKFYEKALKRVIDEYKKHDGAAEAKYYLANLYFQKNTRQFESPENNYLKEAHKICIECEEEYPDSYGAEMCKGLKVRIENKNVRIKTEQVSLPGEHTICQVEYKNVSKLYFRLQQLDRKSHAALSEMNMKKIAGFLDDLPVLRSWETDLNGTEDFRKHSTEIAIPSLDLGVYALVASDDPSFNPEKSMIQVSAFFISKLAFWYNNTGKENLLYVVDRKTGEALEGVKVKLYSWDYEGRSRIKRFVSEKISNEKGAVEVRGIENRRNNFSIELENEEESVFFDNSLYVSRHNNKERVKQRILYFTDRSVYRPGQTIYFKGLLMEESSKDLPRILPNQEDLEVTLYDVNNQKISSLTVNSNEYASFSGSFSLPSSGLTGQMSIGCDRTRDRVHFSMEEYKRPKFQVSLDDYEQAYKLGDKIELEGKAQSYAGVNISNAKVVYRVMRKTYFPFWRYYYRPNPFNRKSIEISNGSLVSDKDGNFKIPVELLADDLVPTEYKPYFRYDIEVDVVDLTGETHSAKKSMQASWLTKDVSMNLPKKVHADSLLNMNISSKNWSGKEQAFEGDLRIVKLKDPQKIFRKRFWSRPDIWTMDKMEFEQLLPYYSYKDEEDQANWEEVKLVKEKSIDIDKSTDFDFELATGSYKFILSFKEPGGEVISLEKYTSVYDDKNLAALELFNFEASGGEPGQKGKIALQSDASQLNVLFELFEKNGRSKDNWFALTDKKIIDLDIEEKHRGNFFVRSTYVYNNRLYTETRTVEVPWSNKELEIEYKSFRSKLLPGAEEKWTLKILGPKKEVEMAEMLASMYDASLDDIKGHNWWANLYRSNYLNSSISYFGFGQTRVRNFVHRDWNEYYTPSKRKSYQSISWMELQHYPGFSTYREDLGVVEMAAPRTTERMMSKRVANGEVDAGAVIMDGVNVEETEADMETRGAGSTEEEMQEQKEKEFLAQDIRSNLDETVFFYPHLKTDEEGNILIEFTMNEALTSWNFMAFAHTKDLKVGFSNNEVITQKELMVRPNAPRFVRLGDQFRFSTSISNLGDTKMDGEVWIELYDGESMKEWKEGALRVSPITSVVEVPERITIQKWALCQRIIIFLLRPKHVMEYISRINHFGGAYNSMLAPGLMLIMQSIS